MKADVEAIRGLIQDWYATREWAEQLLREHLGLASADEVLSQPHRGSGQLGDTEWHYRTHGGGVDVHLPGDRGGIDFDFDRPDPDAWRLEAFLVKQYNAGNLNKRTYRPFLQNRSRFSEAVEVALGQARRLTRRCS